MEDIDDLLDEVETKYVKRLPQSKDLKSNHPGGDSKLKTTVQAPSKKSKSSAIDAAIDDILDLDLDEKCQIDTYKSHKSSSSKDISGRPEQVRRCLPVYLGGAEVSQGIGSTVNQRACDLLRCTSCDFKVCTFDNMAWKKDTDYLFLRNNVPDFDKLKAKLIKKRGWRAYCCQCCWRNILELCELTDSELKWVCGKHVL